MDRNLVRLIRSSLRGALASVRAADFARAYGSDSFWWTVGGDDFRPLAMVARRMPDPFLMTGMLTGKFDAVFR